MKRVLMTVALLAWGLWLGGMIAVIVLVIALFSQDRAVALAAAPRMFHVFEVYQLFLAAAALAAALLWRRKVLATLFALAAVGALASHLAITPRMDALQQLHQTETPEFAQLHGIATTVYMVDAALLLAAGLILPRSIKRS
jgi:glucan phosphoethanolaminetransferase (alkaline phosphatase superfamily)